MMSLKFVVLLLLCCVMAAALSLHKTCTFAEESKIMFHWKIAQQYLTASAASPEPQTLYDVADYLNPLLEGAIVVHCEKDEPPTSSGTGCSFYLDEIAGVLENGANGAKRVKELFVDMGGSWVVNRFNHSVVAWLFNSTSLEHPIEVLLDSSQFLYSNVRLLHAIGKYVPKPLRTDRMRKFVESMGVVVSQSILRWVFGPGSFEVHGWGCSGSEIPYNHSVFVRKKAERAFGRTKGPSYCNAVQDVDMWVITASLHLLGTHSHDPSIVSLTEDDVAALTTYVQEGVALIESRVTTDFNVAGGFSFDLGLWDHHPDWAYAEYEGYAFPTAKPPVPTNTTWDVSHSQRFVNVLLTIDSLADIGKPRISNWTSHLGKQLKEVIYNNNCSNPLFVNYLNGNGWYRVNYHGSGFGYGIFDDGSESIIHGGYGVLAAVTTNPRLSSDLTAMMECVDSMIPNNVSAPISPWLQEHYYVEWSSFHRSPSFWKLGSLDTALRLLQFYPAFVRC